MENNETLKSSRKKRKFKFNSDTVYYIINTAILAFLTLIVVYPLYFLVIASFSDPDMVINGEVLFYPRGITFTGFVRLFEDNKIWNGYLNTIINTVASTAISLVITITAGYGFSRPNMRFKKFFLWLFIITMFFGGGLIPFYLVVSRLGWVNTRWALIVPSALNVWNVFMTKAFFESNIPDGILEAARIDVANEFTAFVRIVLPVSQAVIAVMFLFYAVGNWNSYFNALIFITTKDELFPLQMVLREILIVENTGALGGGSSETILEQLKLANQLKYTSIIVSTVPILCLYPFVQKYFSQGIMIGSLKG